MLDHPSVTCLISLYISNCARSSALASSDENLSLALRSSCVTGYSISCPTGYVPVNSSEIGTDGGSVWTLTPLVAFGSSAFFFFGRFLFFFDLSSTSPFSMMSLVSPFSIFLSVSPFSIFFSPSTAPSEGLLAFLFFFLFFFLATASPLMTVPSISAA